jgi:hypothetical protein
MNAGVKDVMPVYIQPVHGQIFSMHWQNPMEGFIGPERRHLKFGMVILKGPCVLVSALRLKYFKELNDS